MLQNLASFATGLRGWKNTSAVARALLPISQTARSILKMSQETVSSQIEFLLNDSNNTQLVT